MSTRVTTLLLTGLLLQWAAPRALPDSAPSRLDLDQIVAEVATFESGKSLEPLRHIEELVQQAVAEPALRPHLEAGLVQLLGASATLEARRFACKQLAIVGGVASLPALGSLAQDPRLAGFACLALLNYPPGKADEALRNAYAGAAPGARAQILNALGDRRDRNAVSLLARAASDADPAVAEAALVALGKVGDAAAWKVLAARGANTAPALQAAVTEATLQCAHQLTAAGDTKLAASIYGGLLANATVPAVRRGAFAALCRLDKDQGEQRIVQALRGSDALLKPVAIAAVPAVRRKSASETFGAELAHLQAPEQICLLESLAARGDASSRAVIANSLGAGDGTVRRAAIAAMGQVGDATSVSLLAQTLSAAKDAAERRAVEQALQDLAGGAETDQAILTERIHAAGEARASLVSALARRRGAAANPILLDEARGSDPAAATAALRALARTAGEPEMPALLQLLVTVRAAEVRAEAEQSAARVLGRIEPMEKRSAQAREALDAAKGPEARRSLLSLLPVCGDSKALAALKSAVADREAQVRQSAIQALADWPGAAAWNALAEVYAHPESDALRAVALRGLVRMATEENSRPSAVLLDHYQQLLADARGAAELKMILGGLAGLADPAALELVVPRLAETEIRPEAEIAVKRIAEAIRDRYPDAAAAALRRLDSKP